MRKVSQSIRRFSSAAGMVALLGLLLLALPASARPPHTNAAPKAAQCATSTPAGWVQLPGHIPPIMAYAHLLHPTSPDHSLTLSIGFRPNNQAALNQFMQNLQDPASPDYHQYLSPEEYQARFGPTPGEIAQVSDFLARFHLQIGQVAGFLMQAIGSVSQVECAFAIQIDDYQLGNRVVYAPAHNPSVPAAIAPYLQAIIGLDDAAQIQPIPITNP
ncbi:MAG TPA: protease pro-enzyme activation domain-containing protein [Ktedonobacterales bacterium]|jgi:kumamolisin